MSGAFCHNPQVPTKLHQNLIKQMEGKPKSLSEPTYSKCQDKYMQNHHKDFP